MAKGKAYPKTVCPVSRSEFAQHARPLDLSIAGNAMQLDPKQFSTGSIGWFASGKVPVEINGKRVTAQLSLNLTAVGSKELPTDNTPAAPPAATQDS